MRLDDGDEEGEEAREERRGERELDGGDEEVLAEPMIVEESCSAAVGGLDDGEEGSGVGFRSAVVVFGVSDGEVAEEVGLDAAEGELVD